MRRCLWLCVCTLMVCVMAAPLGAATVAGRVTDATGAGVPGARVVLKDQATGKDGVRRLRGKYRGERGERNGNEGKPTHRDVGV